LKLARVLQLCRLGLQLLCSMPIFW
jgi:hypothetical protein